MDPKTKSVTEGRAWKALVAHQQKIRDLMITSPAFNGERLIGAILFENTMDREIEGATHG